MGSDRTKRQELLLFENVRQWEYLFHERLRAPEYRTDA